MRGFPGAVACIGALLLSGTPRSLAVRPAETIRPVPAHPSQPIPPDSPLPTRVPPSSSDPAAKLAPLRGPAGNGTGTPQHTPKGAPLVASEDSGEMLLLSTLSRLEGRPHVAANIFQRASIDGIRFEGGGRYLQQWNRVGDKLRVRMQVQAMVGKTQVSLLQISNGDRIWIERTTPDGKQVGYVDLPVLRDRLLTQASAEALATSPGSATPLPTRFDLSGQHGGLPSLIAGLHENFTFSAPVAMMLRDVQVDSTIGVWKPAALAALYPPAAGTDTEAASSAGEPPEFPPYLPGSVLLLVGKDDRFPYVIEYRRLEADPAAAAPDPADFRMSVDPLLLLRFYQVDFRTPAPDREFDYMPPDGIDHVDQTPR